MHSRRNFLKIVGTTTGGMLFLPEFLTALPADLYQNNFLGNRQIVVTLQLNGGNDGLNTFIPYENPLYYEYRRNIGIPKNEVLKVANGMGFHPIMTGMHQMVQDGNLSVLQNVGYPNPNRSHFRSVEIWQTATNSNEYASTGWLGRYLDATCKGDDPIGGMTIDSIDALALRGQSAHALTMTDPIRFEKQLKALKTGQDDPIYEHPNLDFVRKLMIGSFEGADQIQAALEKTKTGMPNYPKYGLATNLSWVARMIKGDLPTSVYYTSLSGFDTHSNQKPKHQNLWKEVSESVKAFYDDMKAAGLLQNVTLMIFSEFGRRAKENGSGTDHGAAAPVFVIGGGNKGKIIGANPDLSDLNNGDLKFQTDFRSIYATLLKQKLNTNPMNIGIQAMPINGLF
ncbi:MAG: hypothetical protein RLZZ628_778 [Bacteroidota bacterium]|jgi:uncharacterized protein (DUF1501 family)